MHTYAGGSASTAVMPGSAATQADCALAVQEWVLWAVKMLLRNGGN